MLGTGIRFVWLVLVSSVMALAPRAWAQATEKAPGDKTLAPYFVVEHGDPRLDRLPLESTRVQIAISNVIADVSVTQVYKNAGTGPPQSNLHFPRLDQGGRARLTDGDW